MPRKPELTFPLDQGGRRCGCEWSNARRYAALTRRCCRRANRASSRADHEAGREKLVTASQTIPVSSSSTHERLFTAFRMTGQRAVPEPAPARLVNDPDHTAWGKDPNGTNTHAHDHDDIAVRAGRRGRHFQAGPPVQLPALDGRGRSSERDPSLSQPNPMVQMVVAVRQFGLGGAHLGVGQRSVPQLCDQPCALARGRWTQAVHWRPRVARPI
jgi:hypothetical protein